MSRGLFITFEGTDGTGKSTQIEFAREYFESRGFNVLMSREPGGTSISEKLRGILLDKANGEMSPVTEMMIYAASRAQLVSEVIIPAVNDGTVVICDRFVDSSVAYQAFGRGLGDMVAEVNSYATTGLAPDITFFMDIDPEVGRSRIAGGELDRLEQEKSDFFRRVYDGYKSIAALDPGRVKTIDASGTVEEVRAAIEVHLDEITGRMGLDG